MAIIPFKICMPCVGYQETHTYWVNVSMIGQDLPIYALDDALILIEQDGGLFLKEKFMNGIFNKIHTDASRICVPLPPLAETMTYQYEKKKNNAIDGSKVLPFEQLNAELFYPKRIANVEITGLVKREDYEIANCILNEFCDPRKQHLIT